MKRIIETQSSSKEEAISPDFSLSGRKTEFGTFSRELTQCNRLRHCGDKLGQKRVFWANVTSEMERLTAWLTDCEHARR